MKKGKITAALLLTLALTAAGCGDASTAGSSAGDAGSSAAAESSQTSSVAPSDSETSSGDYEKLMGTKMSELLDGINPSDYVTLGEYHGAGLTKNIYEVTDADIDEKIQDALSTAYTTVDRAAQDGDTVSIEYVGKIDGEAFDGGSTQEGSPVDLVLGSDSYIDGFEDGLIGAKAGDTVTLNLTFPKNYSEDLGGKDVVFEVTVDAVKEKVTELSVDWITENTEYSTVDEYRESIEKELAEENEDTSEDELNQAAWNAVTDVSTVSEVPEKVLTFGSELYQAQVDEICTYYSLDMDGYLSAMGMTQEDFDEAKAAYAENMGQQILILAAVESAEGMSVEDDEYKEILDDYLLDKEMDEATFIASYGEFNVEQSIMMQRVCTLVINNAQVTEQVAEDSSASESSETTETTESAASETAETASSAASESTESAETN